jgi:hypothetical protein
LKKFLTVESILLVFAKIGIKVKLSNYKNVEKTQMELASETTKINEPKQIPQILAEEVAAIEDKKVKVTHGHGTSSSLKHQQQSTIVKLEGGYNSSGSGMSSSSSNSNSSSSPKSSSSSNQSKKQRKIAKKLQEKATENLRASLAPISINYKNVKNMQTESSEPKQKWIILDDFYQLKNMVNDERLEEITSNILLAGKNTFFLLHIF